MHVLTTKIKVTKDDKANYLILWIGTNFVRNKNGNGENKAEVGQIYSGLTCYWLLSNFANRQTFTNEELIRHYGNELHRKNHVLLFKVLKILSKDKPLMFVTADNQVAMLKVLKNWFESKSKKIEIEIR